MPGSALAACLSVDARYAWRSLRHSRSFALISILTLACGIGLSTSVFSLVAGILANPLPYAHSERLVRISEMTARGGYLSGASIGVWASTDTAVSHISPHSEQDVTAMLPDGAASLAIADVGADFFTILAMPPAAGRLLARSDLDDGAAPAVVISERLARRSFGGADAALGKPVGLETQPHVVVGVVSHKFAYPSAAVDLWRVGTGFRRYPAPGPATAMFYAPVVGLLREGATAADADAGGRRVAEQIGAATPGSAGELTRFKTDRLLDDLVAPVKPALLTLTLGMTLVLLAGCVSLANLVLARHTSRQRELAVRVALGAGRWRLARPVLFELLIILIVGSTGGGLLAVWLLQALPAIAPADLPRIETIHFDWRALLTAVAVCGGMTVSLGLWPVLRLPSADVRELMSAGGRVRLGGSSRSADRTRGVLVAAQVALAMVLLVSALLIGRSLTALLDVPLGYQPDRLLVVQAAHPASAAKEPGRLARYYRDLTERLRRHPSVTSVGAAGMLPMHAASLSGSSFQFSGMALTQAVSADYLRTMGTRVIKGRGFNSNDTDRVVVIDELVERKHFPDGDAVGQQVRWEGGTATIVGVVEPVRMGGIVIPQEPTIYSLDSQVSEQRAYGRSGGLVVRTKGDPSDLVTFARQAAREVDATVPLFKVGPWTNAIDTNVAQPRFFTVILGLFALLALSTALLGIYGVLAFAVERRRLELGIRRALGATERHVIALVIRRGILLALVGIGAGLGGAAVTARLMRSMLFGVTPADPVSYAAASTIVLGVVLLASWQPVLRALRDDPARALRADG